MKKRALSLLLALLLCLSLLPAAVFAEEDDGDADTDPVETTEPETPGSSADFQIDDGVLRKYRGSGGDVTIPSGVTRIDNFAFNACSGLTSVTIPSSVTTIGYCAFYACSGLTSVTIPYGVTTIEHAAFSTCLNLTSVTIPSSVTIIGDRAFATCENLASVTIPSSVTTIERQAFEDCVRLTSVTIQYGVTSIEDEAFGNCARLPSVTIPSSVTSIGSNAFAGCDSLASVTIPSSITEVGNYVFANCDRLEDVYYDGTQAQWKASKLSNSSNWMIGVYDDFRAWPVVVHCSDGTIGKSFGPGELDDDDFSLIVYFDTRDGRSMSSKTVIYGKTYGELPTPTREGFIFDGWYTSITGGSQVTSSTMVPDEFDHTLYARWISTDAKLNVSPHSVSFDKAKVGYAQPAAKTVTVTNIGEVDVTLTQPSASNFDLGTLSKTKLAPGASATFTVRPKAGLKAGSYSDSITVKSTDGKSSPAVSVSFTVEGENQETQNIPFTDVPAWANQAVAWAVEKKITNGTSPTTFSADSTCTRAHILTFLYRAKGEPAVSTANPFTDVKESDYFCKAAIWASEQGLVSGKALDSGAPCTRAAVVTYLWKLAGSPAAKYDNTFTDVAANAEYAQAVAWAVANGVTNGMSDTTFAPDSTCTRGQIVTFLYRAYK